MILLLAGLGLGGLCTWFAIRAQGSGATTQAGLPMDRPLEVDSALLVLSMRKGRR